METQGVALVVGAGGIGCEIVHSLALHEATAVICADISCEAAQQALENAQRKVSDRYPDLQTLAIHVDVTNAESVQTMLDVVKNRFGRADYFVNSSGYGAVGQTPISSYTVEEYRKLDETHHIATFLLLRAVTTCMLHQDLRTIPLPMRSAALSERSQNRGTIVIVASLASEGGYIGVAPYVAAKHAVKGLVKTCALENARKGIRINAVSPSYVAGPMIDKLLQEAPAIKDGMLSDLPLGRIADPEEVADTVCFLCSGLSTYINGHTLIVDGGASASLAKGAF